MGSRKKSSVAVSGTPMKQLTITESFTLRKSFQVSEKKQRPSEIINPSKANMMNNNIQSSVIRRLPKVYYPIGFSDSESENEEQPQPPPQVKPMMVMKLNKPASSKLNNNVYPGLDDSCSSINSDETIVYESSPNGIRNKIKILSDTLIVSRTSPENIEVEVDPSIYETPTVPNSPCTKYDLAENHCDEDKNSKANVNGWSMDKVTELKRKVEELFSEREEELSRNKENKTKNCNKQHSRANTPKEGGSAASTPQRNLNEKTDRPKTISSPLSLKKSNGTQATAFTDKPSTDKSQPTSSSSSNSKQTSAEQALSNGSDPSLLHSSSAQISSLKILLKTIEGNNKKTPNSQPLKRRLDFGDRDASSQGNKHVKANQAPSSSNLSSVQILPSKSTQQKKITVASDKQEPSCSHSNATTPCSKNIQENGERTPISNPNSSSLKSPQEKKITVLSDNQEPSCSQSTTTTPASKFTQGSCRNTPTSTPNSSPLKRKLRSPRGSPKKMKVAQLPIKNLKAKDGKQLQKKQLDLLVNLVHEVYSNVHLKSLISAEEDMIIKKFVACEDKHRYVVMKLFLWKKMWYNIFQFCNKGNIEIGDEKEIIKIFDFLKEEQLVLTDFKRCEDMTGLLNNLNRFDVKHIAKKLTRKEGRSKEENIGLLVQFAATQATLSFAKSSKDIILDEIAKKMGDSIKLKPEVYDALNNVYLLATFVNNDFENIQDCFNALINNNVMFPRYIIEPYVLFYSRDKFLSYAKARKSLRELDELRTNKNRQGILELGRHVFQQLKNLEKEDEESDSFRDAPHLKRFTASHVYHSILCMCACKDLFTTEHETVKIWLEYLVNRFPNSARNGKCFYTLIWIYMKYLKPANFEAAADLLIDVLKNKRAHLNEIDMLEFGKLARKIVLRKRQKVDQSYHDQLIRLMPPLIDVSTFPEDEFDAEYIETELKGKRNYKLQDPDGNVTINSVEKMALEYYRLGLYPEGAHCEGSLIKHLMVLLFWDLIYEPTKLIPGSFISELQSVPLDMFTNYFYMNRADIINERLDAIGGAWSEEEVRRFAKDMYQKNSHQKAVYGEVMLTIENENKIDELLDVIDRKLLADIFRRILSNVRAYSSGMPDLLVWNREEKTCKFVEVKGHGDKLSSNQELWLDYLQRKRANIAVCYVHSKGNKKTKKSTKLMTK